MTSGSKKTNEFSNFEAIPPENPLRLTPHDFARAPIHYASPVANGGDPKKRKDDIKTSKLCIMRVSDITLLRFLVNRVMYEWQIYRVEFLH